LQKKAKFLGTGIPIEAEACGFVSGKIEGKDNIVSCTIQSALPPGLPLISFNPRCAAISAGDHYFSPALAVSHEGIDKILAAKDVRGDVVIEKVEHTSANILIGNSIAPRCIVFSHYDSIKKGAIDDASGVAVMLRTLLENNKLLEETLFVIAGNEELSFRNPIYWGFGYQAFEDAYGAAMRQAEKIVVVDCVGYGTPSILKDDPIVSFAFPLVENPAYGAKTSLLSGSYEALMGIYHSDLDDGRGITKESMDASVALLLTEIS